MILKKITGGNERIVPRLQIGAFISVETQNPFIFPSLKMM